MGKETTLECAHSFFLVKISFTEGVTGGCSTSTTIDYRSKIPCGFLHDKRNAVSFCGICRLKFFWTARMANYRSPLAVFFLLFFSFCVRGQISISGAVNNLFLMVGLTVSESNENALKILYIP